MQTIHGYNGVNESQIVFACDERAAYASEDEFYAATVTRLWEGWDSAANTERFIRNASKKRCDPEDLRTAVRERLRITPIAEGAPDLHDIQEAYSFRDDWNDQGLSG